MADSIPFIQGLIDLIFGNMLCLITSVVLGIVIMFVIVVVFIRRILKRDIWRY